MKIQESKLNRNDDLRHDILGIAYKENECYDIKRIPHISLIQLEALQSHNMLELAYTQNDAPPIAEIMNFLKDNPSFHAHGYIVHPDRPDYRVSLEGVETHTPPEKEEIMNFAFKFRHADEFTVTSEHCYAWFD